MIEKLKKLGLTGYEAQAYIALLELGDSEADEIASKARIPMGRIYSVLSNLEEYRLARAQETRPRRYACVEPSTALQRLMKNKHEELERTGAEMEALANDLVSELSGVKTTTSSKPFWTVAIGDKSEELLQECILGARKEILFFMASRTASERLKKKLNIEKYPGIISSIHEALNNGTDIKVILNKDVDFSVVEDFSAIKRLLEHMGNEFNCRLAATPATPFHIIDRESVLLQMLNPLAPDELFAVVNIRDTKLAEELRKKFFAIWERAEAYPENNNSSCQKKM
ncbi:HTH-type sugar sensing transcriptional regulator TrmBL1 [uncultured archaeon]|nr:HTH-type sugar sensing transcriptional regulator TrmBL1 [uncultured archaeon]